MTDENSTDLASLAALVAQAEDGSLSHLDLIAAFLTTTIFVPSTADPAEGEISPVTINFDDTDFMVVAATEFALQQTRDVATFAVPMIGRDVANHMNPELALLINLNEGAFALPKAMLDDIRAQHPLG